MKTINGIRRHPAAIAAVFLGVLLAAGCGGRDDAPPPPPPPAVGSATLGATGGTVDGPDGVRLTVPADALPGSVTFRVARDGTGAPELEGLVALSPIYAVTPHGQSFDAGALLSIPLSAASVPAGVTPVLLKSEPGGRWRVVPNASTDPTRMAADLDSLSFFVIGACSSTPTDLWTIGAPGCPANHTLSLTILDNAGGAPVPIARGPNGVGIPLWFATDTVQTRTFVLTWSRPAGVTRTDQLSVVGTPGGFSAAGGGFTTTWSPAVQEATGSVSRSFTVTIDPSRVGGAAGPNGRLLRVKGAASYSTTAFRIGRGDVLVGFDFEADIPILVRFSGPTPNISTQPANTGVIEGQSATFSVVAAATPPATLTYRWSRRANVNASFAPIAGATAATYTLAAAALGDNGAQFQVEVCVVATTRCVTSAPATLSVTRAPVVPSFGLQPASLAVTAGQTASFTATATGVPAPAIRWQSAAAGGSTFSDVTSAGCTETIAPASGDNTTSTCTVGPLVTGDSGRRYRALAVNAAAPAGVPSSEATLTVSAAPQPPTITTPPGAQTAIVGGSATFNVAATGTAPLNATWRINGTDLTAPGPFTIGACTGTASFAGTSVTLSGLSAGCNGASVVVVVSNGINPNATSTAVILTVSVPPAAGPCFSGSSGWCYARPLPQADSVRGLVFVNGGFTAVGGRGMTLRTSDNGSTWQAAYESSRTEWFDLASPTPGLLVAAGLPKTPAGQVSGVFVSTDGGLTWTRRVTAPANGDVSRVAFADASLGIASGVNGIWRTTDGGQNWSLVANPPAALNGIVVGAAIRVGGIVWADSSTVLIYGSQGGILRSIDGGLTWADVTPAGAQDDLYDMAFNAAGVGVAVGPAQQALRSADFGATWQVVSTGMGETGSGVAFADATTVVALGSLSQTMRSTDGGLNWTVGFRLGGSNVYRLRFASSSVGLAVGEHGQVLRTSDAGDTWTQVGGGSLDQRVNSLARSPNGTVLLAGALNAPLQRSTTLGATWTSTGVSYRGPSFASDQVVVALDPFAQRIARSADAGQTWSVVYNQPGAALRSVTMASSSNGFAVGTDGLVLRTTDGGQTWNAVASGTTLPLNSSGCLTSTLCLAGGFGGVLLRSTDAGATWSAGSVPTLGGSIIRGIARLTDSIALLASDDGIWRSVDAGQTWTRVYTVVLGSMQSVSFSSAGVGIGAGYDGILRSTDQGLTWVRQDVPIGYSLYASVWVDASTVLVGGEGGALLRNAQSGVP